MIYSTKRVDAMWNGKVIEITPSSPLDIKKYGYSNGQVACIEQHIVNKNKGLTTVKPDKNVTVEENAPVINTVLNTDIPKVKGGRPKAK